MSDNEELLKNIDIGKIAKEGSKIYEEIKDQYLEHKGKFLAIGIESKDVYLADNSAEAVMQARKDHPGKIFYVVKIGFSVAETLANLEGEDTCVVGIEFLKKFRYDLNLYSGKNTFELQR